MKRTSLLLLYTALLCSTGLPSSVAAQCPSGALPLRVSGEKVYGSSYQCSGSDSAEVQDALQSLNDRVDKEIESVLPQIQAFLTPSPCSGPDWKRVVYIDMTNASHSCPLHSGWYEGTLEGKRVCRRTDPTKNSCGEAEFKLDDIMGAYTKVCGRIRAYTYGSPEAFGRIRAVMSTQIDEEYVDGVSITHGKHPRHHIWTFAAGARYSPSVPEHFLCPCDIETRLSVDFIGDNYFCESSGTDDTNTANVLWDGRGCDSTRSTCCTFNDPPYFVATLDEATCDSIDVRMCASDGDEGTPIELIELYVK